MSIAEAFRRSCEAAPDKLAVVAEDGTATFRQLHRMSGAIASRLAESGVGRGDKVALLLGNDEALHFNAAYFGIHLLGAVPVPLNVRWAEPELLFVLEHSDAIALVAGAKRAPVLAGALTGGGAEIGGRPVRLTVRASFVSGSAALPGFVALGEVTTLVSTEVKVPELVPPVTDDEPADLLYTSGTTGMPKGVLVPEGNLADRPGQAGLSQVLGSLFGESLLHAVPLFGFTGCHGLMLMSVRAGITQIVLPRFDPERMLAAIEEHRATSLMGVPTMLNLAMNHPAVHKHDYSSLRFVFFGAAPIQPDTVRKMLEVWPQVQMLNGYGLTEGGAGSACMLGPNPQDILDRPGSVGRPVGCDVVVLGEAGDELAQGEVGEICFRSTAPRRRYYKGDASTEELWDGGVLHTGDVGYVAADGYVYLTDRKKDMVLRGGYNIFAVEVERVLLEIPEVLEAAVVAVPHPVLGEDILAVIAPQPDATPGVGPLSATEINTFCRRHLADYKCPRHVTFLPELPKNAMAKVLKGELRDQFHDYLVTPR